MKLDRRKIELQGRGIVKKYCRKNREDSKKTSESSQLRKVKNLISAAI